ncbi:MAG: glycosyltransferase [Bryobacteraceae bacterium]
MRAGFFSPLPPARSGVADYSSALLGALRRFGPVEVGSSRADVALYHLGNNPLHRSIHAQALAHPGVVVLHDAVLQHFYLGALPREEYVEEFVYNYGGWHRGLAEEMWRRRAVSGSDAAFFRYPMLRRIAEASRAVIVHNPAAADLVRSHSAKTPVIEIPCLFRPQAPLSESERLRFRQTLGLSPAAFLFGVFGYLRESKRLLPILRVFQKLRERGLRLELLVAGSFVSTDLARAALPLMAQPGVRHIGHLPADVFRKCEAAVDACINLRYPAAGETSAVSIQLMGAGRPVLLTAGAENERYPETGCIRVDSGIAESELLAHYMHWLASFRDAGPEIGRRAAEHIRRHHDLNLAAERYWNVLCAYRD